MEKICMVVGFGIAATASILIGREIGAGRTQTVQQVGMALSTLAFLCGLAVGCLLVLFAQWIAPLWVFPLFQLSPGASRIAAMMITVSGLMIPIKNFNQAIIVGVLRGGGDVRASTIIDLTPLWLVAIPLTALTGLVLKLDIFWVYLCIPSENIIKFFVGMRRLRSGRWINDVTGTAARE